MKSPAAKRKKRKLPKTISREEAAALMKAPNLHAPTGLRNRCMLELMYRGGLRVGEVVALTVRDVDLKRGTIRVLAGKGGDGTAYFDTSAIAQLLEEWKRERRRLGVSAKAPLFCTLKGGAVSVRYVEQMIQRMARRAGVSSPCTPHVLRHTFATELLDEHFTIRQVQEALRHADLGTTMVYTHVLDADLRDRIQRRSVA
jgi:site-specific recombinase XerD